MQNEVRDAVMDHVKIRLLSSVYHADLLENLLRKQIAGDVYLSFYVKVDDMKDVLDIPAEIAGQNGILAVTENVAAGFQLTVDDLYSAAMSHDSFLVERMATVLNRLSGEEYYLDEETPDVPMLCVSSQTNLFGASAILSKSAQEQIFELLGTKDVYCIPSSIFETLIVPQNADYTPEDIVDMIKSINESTVQPRDRLSDSLFAIKNGSLVSVSC